ncbi:MAG: DUF2071 domain-containing protein [Pyrinomonadaceae bacterium]
MFSFLKNHLFAVEAFFESSLVLTFAVPKDELQNLIPECLELDTFEEKYAFVAAAMVQTTKLRPKGFPESFGKDFFLVGYRIFVRYTNNSGKRMRGLYILKSETDKKQMEFFGNLFTHYSYTTTDIEQIKQDAATEIKSSKSDFKVVIENPSNEEILLPETSPFATWKEARRFAGPLPFTFTFNAKTKEVLIIEGVRQNWTPQPVKVESCHFSFLDRLNLSEMNLANAFIINNIPYMWKKGRIEQWNK